MIYLDNAATTIRKPDCVFEAMKEAMVSCGNAGRGAGKPALTASREIYRARKLLCDFFGGSDPARLVFTMNATESLNIVLHGLFDPGDHVITTEAEHNSVLRPLYAEEKRGAELSIVPMDEKGWIDPDRIEQAIRPDSKAIVCTHGSNVLGTIYDMQAIGKIAKRHGLLFIVDASQTAGAVPIDVNRMHIDVLCFTGHKALYGPQGTGGIYVSPGVEIRPLLQGGSGVHSFSKEHPSDLPTALEAGTLNSHGIAGLAAAVAYLNTLDLAAIHRKEAELSRLFAGLVGKCSNVKLYGDFSGERETGAIVSLNIGSVDSSEISRILMEEYGIATRSGAHCAPLLHKRMGTVQQGMVRFSFSMFTSEEEVKRAAEAVLELANDFM